MASLKDNEKDALNVLIFLQSLFAFELRSAISVRGFRLKSGSSDVCVEEYSYNFLKYPVHNLEWSIRLRVMAW